MNKYFQIFGLFCLLKPEPPIMELELKKQVQIWNKVSKFSSFWVVLHIGTETKGYATDTQNWSSFKLGSGTETRTALRKKKKP
jgi:hypothetical protein